MEEIQYDTIVGEKEDTDYTDPDNVDYDVYNEVEKLERWEEILSDQISNNDITQEEYDEEMLKTRYYIDIRTKTYVLDDEETKVIENLRSYKEALIQAYAVGPPTGIDEKEFNKKYTDVLRKEYDILRSSESTDLRAKKINVDIDLPLEDKLRKLHEEEIKFNKQVAKKYKIPIPNIPPGIISEEIDIYYDKKVVNKLDIVNPVIEDYLKKLSAAKKLIGYYTSSYEITKIFYNTEYERQEFSFKTIAPISTTIDRLKIQQKRSNLLTMDERFYSDRLNTLKDRLRDMSREDLLECVGIRVYKYMSYIERLFENKQEVIKFNEHPENYEMLKSIILEDNLKYYKVSSDKLFKDYVYSHPEILQSYLDDIVWGDADLSFYSQKGSVSYLAIKKGADLKNLGDNLEDYITIKPLPNELFLELSEKEGSKTEIDSVWELRLSLPGSDKHEIIKRYLSFDDYLKDLREILIKNSKKLSGKSRDSLNAKIRKISYYLKYEKDYEFYLPNGHVTVSELFENRSEIFSIRRNGLYKLLEYATAYYPDSQVLIERIESDIFNYSSKNYSENINKVIFIFRNYQNKLYDLLEGDESIINLLTYEVPNVLPENDIDTSDKPGSINKLLEWRPNTSEYDIYQSELENLNFRFIEFKKTHPELTNLYISQIMSQYSEKLQWDRSLTEYNSLEVPEGSIELNFRLRYLLKRRNRLPSRRIYRVSTIKSRIINQSELTSVFRKCKVPEPEDYSVLTEKLIYGMSKSPEDYIYYSSLIKREYRKLCNFFTKVNLKCSLDESGVVKCILSFEPNILSPLITEFLITQGEFNEVDISRLKQFAEEVDSDTVIKYIHNLRGPEIEAYSESIISQLNTNPSSLKEIYLKAIRIMKSHKLKWQLSVREEISDITYKPPLVSNTEPVEIHLGKTYTPEYIKIGDHYVYGGNFPDFNMWSETGEVIRENYTRNDLENLAVMYNLDVLDDSYELYKSIEIFRYENLGKDKPVYSKERLNFSPTEYNDYYEYLQTPKQIIWYTIRPRKDIEEPGEVYRVIKDPVNMYGVPYDFDKYTVPIYSSDLKELWKKSFITIEDPFKWGETNEFNKLTSDSYIQVEYRDSARGKIKLVREGVSLKKIIKRPLDKLNTCSRFLNEPTCNHENSYSLLYSGLKYKCKWLSDKCKGVIVESDNLRQFNLIEVDFKDDRNRLWNVALEKSMNYIEEIVKLTGITRQEIELISKEQKLRLYNYYKVLEEKRQETVIVERELFDIKSYKLPDELDDLLNFDKPVFINKTVVYEGYTKIVIYKNIIITRNYPIVKNIKIGSDYLVNKKYVIPRLRTEDGSYVCDIKDSDETIILKREDFRKETNELITKTIPIFCLISNEDFKYLDGYMGYYWNLKTDVYNRVDLETVITRILIERKTFIPLNFITPSENLNGLPLITKSDLFNAMNETAFSNFTLEGLNNYIIKEKVNAKQDAIDFAIKNNIDINKLFEKIIGTIGMLDVITEFESVRPKIFITKDNLIKIITDAIENEDKEILMSHYIRARNVGIDKDLLKKAKGLIKTLPDKEKKIEEDKQIKKPAAASSHGKISIHATTRRM